MGMSCCPPSAPLPWRVQWPYRGTSPWPGALPGWSWCRETQICGHHKFPATDIKPVLAKPGPGTSCEPVLSALSQTSGLVLVMANPLLSRLQNRLPKNSSCNYYQLKREVFQDFRANLCVCLQCWIFNTYCCWNIKDCIMLQLPTIFISVRMWSFVFITNVLWYF